MSRVNRNKNVSTSDGNFKIRDVKTEGYLYVASDTVTGAKKIGCCQTTPKTRLSHYRRDSDAITFIRTSCLIENVYDAEAVAHSMLKGNVRYVRSDDRMTTSSNPRAEWFQLDGAYTIEDIYEVFASVENLFCPGSINFSNRKQAVNREYLNRKLKAFIDSNYEYLAVIRFKNDPDPPWLDKRFLLTESNKLNRIEYALEELQLSADDLERAFKQNRITYVLK